MSDDRERFYNGIAEDFDQVMNPYDLRRRLAVVFGPMLAGESLSGKLLLDAGCGTGHFSRRAAALGARVVSVDIGPRLLAQARAKCETMLVSCDATSLGLRDGVFDLVVSSEMIEHTRSPRAAVAELARVLRPGGRLVLTCPNALWHWSLRVAHWLKVRPYRGHEKWPGWFQLRRWLREEGIAIERMRGLHLFPFVFRVLNPVLRLLDGLGALLGPLYVNMAVAGIKRADAGAEEGR